MGFNERTTRQIIKNLISLRTLSEEDENHARLAAAHISDLARQIEKLKRCAKLSETFYNDVMPQIGGIGLQDYGAMNDLGIILTELKRDLVI